MVTRIRPRPLTTRPRVSVVVPCYNYGNYLPECVDSILTQSGVEVDVLIVDDASPDGSAEVARRLAADPRVRLIEHQVNQGHIATYNEGLAAATGDYVVLLSADDLLSPGSLARSTALLEAYPEMGFVYGFSAGFNDRPPRPRLRPSSWSVWTGAEWLAENLALASNPVATPEVVMRAATMRELVGYDARVPHGADFLLWLRAATRGSVGRVNGADQAYYRIHGANMHVQQFGGMVRDVAERQRVFEILFAEDGDPIADPDRLHETARAALAREALAVACRSYALGRAGSDAPDRMAELAVALHTDVRDSREWQRYERHSARARPPRVPLPLRELADRVEHRLRWGQWRRTGIRA
jgi:glycosyltransferase involved in cell wall biosynthesis